jgi:hypothetical protein
MVRVVWPDVPNTLEPDRAPGGGGIKTAADEPEEGLVELVRLGATCDGALARASTERMRAREAVVSEASATGRPTIAIGFEIERRVRAEAVERG